MPQKAPSEKGTGSATHLGLCRHSTSPCVRRIDLKWYPLRYIRAHLLSLYRSSSKFSGTEDACCDSLGNTTDATIPFQLVHPYSLRSWAGIDPQ